MKRATKEYVDQQINWVRSIKQMENTWMEKYLETEWRTEREARETYNRIMSDWKKDDDAWRQRIEQIVSQSVSRKELRAMIVTVITLMISFLALLVMIFFKK